MTAERPWMVERRASDLSGKLWPGAELEAPPGVIDRYEEAPDLPHPIQVGSPLGAGVAPPERPTLCPQCKEHITGMDQSNIAAVSPIGGHAPMIAWPDYKEIAGLISVTPCGHAFRVSPDQTILVLQGPAE
ncbi:hypothetical protein ACIBAC_00170 [Streptomyces sp. NPDC051362]|uniref:hypothetical protein n=1 Tax=Streptomyces sp. NPDC051362 TaxID=3365651 RepID=UPI0037B7B7BB